MDDNLDVLRLVREAEGPAPGGEQPAGPGPAPEEPKPDTAALVASLLRGLLDRGFKRFPSLKPVWDESDIKNFSGAAAPLLDKYGFTPGWLESWRVEITALLICGPLVLATVIAVRADLDAERVKAAKDAGSGSTAAPGAEGPPGAAPGVKPKPTGEL